ncbi:hypothetical protein DFQ01_10987 [Paenibacillus cellulosilyticus]|uniref:Uncharacterized protein n=1 Tax=Paenibacillus cellulosilyticus TaxID=375489 RepID=A0A2V2YT06_9BACL|nr:hypothetical protein [Paenibacillus cellulosilyticus]PWW02462.1 hypothetical protein DFQ01_10987 [Paenibacillus cellulosilyticus]QKS47168.1 hypothetical protein HUB94_22255 [Paenibacillus cellulosilyticus]
MSEPIEPAAEKKLSQAEKAKALLAQKKQGKNGGQQQHQGSGGVSAMKSQNNAKPQNHRRKMGV